MNSPVRWTPAADEDLEEIAYYIGVENHSREAAHRLLEEIAAKCEQYARQPQMGTIHPDLDELLRVFSHKRYVIVYRPLDDGIEVLRVVHGSHDFPALFD